MTLAKQDSVLPNCQYPGVLNIPIHKTSVHSGTNERFSLANGASQLTNNCNKISNKHYYKKQSLLSAFTLKILYIFGHETKHLIFGKRYSLNVNHCLVDRSLANYFLETSEHSFVLHARKAGS